MVESVGGIRQSEARKPKRSGSKVLLTVDQTLEGWRATKGHGELGA